MRLDEKKRFTIDRRSGGLLFRHHGVGFNFQIRHNSHLDFQPLAGMAIGSIYEKPSTRTRVSFEVEFPNLAVNH